MMPKESQYLFIKQKLDSYNISTTFPLEVMPLLHNLIIRIDQQAAKVKPTSSAKTNSKPKAQEFPQFQEIQPALRHQLQRTLSQNNILHMELITQKQQIQSLKHCIDKLALESADLSKRDEVRQVIAMCREKQRQLVSELQVVKFKYNELVDFVMGEDELEKMYIKKLINHKKYEQVGEKPNQEGKPQTKNNNKSAQDLNSRITFKAGQSRKQSRQRINKTIETKENNQPQGSSSVEVTKKAQSRSLNEYKLHELEQKLAHRQQEIQRLQSVIRHDGPNLNRIMSQFTHQMQQKQYLKLQERINLLETQNHQVKQQLEKSKLNGGRYQALIEQVQKSHSLIQELKKQNAFIKRLQRQQEFDLEKEKKQYKREFSMAENLKSQLLQGRHSDQALIHDLRKKIEFYQRELGFKQRQGQENIKKDKNQVSNLKVKKNVSKKSNKTGKSTISKGPQEVKLGKNLTQPKNSKPSSIHSQNRQKYEDQINLNEKSEQTKATKTKKSKKQVKKLPISQIIQEEQEDESYVNAQTNENKQDELQHKAYQEENTPQEQENPPKNQEGIDDEQDNQSQDESQVEQKNETMIQQYEQTINELSARCLQLKEQLDSKNQTIQGLQQIVNRLMHNMNGEQILQDNSNGTNGRHPESIPHLTHQVQTLSSLLNQSQFQKQQLRRQLIRVQNLYNQLKGSSPVHQSSPSNQNLEQQLNELKKLLEQKDSKITDMRQDNTTIQDQLLKALDRIRRLNDEIDAMRKENDALKTNNERLTHDLGLNQARLEQAAILLKQQRERNSSTLELSELQKDEIIVLRKGLVKAEERIKDMEEELEALREQNQRLVSQLS